MCSAVSRQEHPRDSVLAFVRPRCKLCSTAEERDVGAFASKGRIRTLEGGSSFMTNRAREE